MERTKAERKKSKETLNKAHQQFNQKSIFDRLWFKNLIYDKNKIRKFLITLLVIFTLLFLLGIHKKIIYLFVFFIFFFINFLFAFFKRFFFRFGIAKYLYGIEIVMFSTVMISYFYGSTIGSISGAFFMIINYLSERRFSKFFIITLPLYYVIGLTAYYFKSYDIRLVGIIYSIFYNILSNFLSRILEPNIKSLFVFNLINFLFNFFIFMSLSKNVYDLLNLIL